MLLPFLSTIASTSVCASSKLSRCHLQLVKHISTDSSMGPWGGQAPSLAEHGSFEVSCPAYLQRIGSLLTIYSLKVCFI